MKILVVSGIQTRPVTSGTGKFIGEYCRLLKEMGHEVFFLHATFFTVNDKNKERVNQGIEGTREQWGDHYFHFSFSLLDRVKEEFFKFYRRKFCNCYAGVDDRYPFELSSYVNKLNSRYHFDACLVNYYWFSKLLTEIDIPRRGIITHDSFTYNNVRNNVKSLLNLTPSEEAKALQRCPFVFAMQNDERVYFERLAPKSKILTSFCNYDYVSQTFCGNHNLVYLSGGFYLNVNGLKWFVENIFPSILSAFPDCRLKIGGTLCEEVKEYENHQNIDLLGLVDDVYEFYSQGDVAINPTYQGTGLKIKTFEAMAFDKVAMVHPHSMNGIFDKANAPIFSSDDSTEWVDFLKKIWNGDGLEIMTIKKKNRDYIERMNKYIKGQFDEFLK